MFSLKITTYGLIVLILFQSFSAVANSLDYHSIDIEHISEVHEHKKDENNRANQLISKTQTKQPNADSLNTTSSLNETSHNPSDCHHCGHCHGTHVQGLQQTTTMPLDALASDDSFYYLSMVIDAPLTQLLRPPRV